MCWACGFAFRIYVISILIFAQLIPHFILILVMHNVLECKIAPQETSVLEIQFLYVLYFQKKGCLKLDGFPPGLDPSKKDAKSATSLPIKLAEPTGGTHAFNISRLNFTSMESVSPTDASTTQTTEPVQYSSSTPGSTDTSTRSTRSSRKTYSRKPFTMAIPLATKRLQTVNDPSWELIFVNRPATKKPADRDYIFMDNLFGHESKIEKKYPRISRTKKYLVEEGTTKKTKPTTTSTEKIFKFPTRVLKIPLRDKILQNFKNWKLKTESPDEFTVEESIWRSAGNFSWKALKIFPRLKRDFNLSSVDTQNLTELLHDEPLEGKVPSKIELRKKFPKKYYEDMFGTFPYPSQISSSVEEPRNTPDINQLISELKEGAHHRLDFKFEEPQVTGMWFEDNGRYIAIPMTHLDLKDEDRSLEGDSLFNPNLQDLDFEPSKTQEPQWFGDLQFQPSKTQEPQWFGDLEFQPSRTRAPLLWFGDGGKYLMVPETPLELSKEQNSSLQLKDTLHAVIIDLLSTQLPAEPSGKAVELSGNAAEPPGNAAEPPGNAAEPPGKAILPSKKDSFPRPSKKEKAVQNLKESLFRSKKKKAKGRSEMRASFSLASERASSERRKAIKEEATEAPEGANISLQIEESIERLKVLKQKLLDYQRQLSTLDDSGIELSTRPQGSKEFLDILNLSIEIADTLSELDVEEAKQAKRFLLPNLKNVAELEHMKFNLSKYLNNMKRSKIVPGMLSSTEPWTMVYWPLQKFRESNQGFKPVDFLTVLRGVPTERVPKTTEEALEDHEVTFDPEVPPWWNERVANKSESLTPGAKSIVKWPDRSPHYEWLTEVIWAYLVLDILWLITTIMIIMGARKRIRGLASLCFYIPWLLVTLAIVAADLAGFIYILPHIHSGLYFWRYLKAAGVTNLAELEPLKSTFPNYNKAHLWAPVLMCAFFLRGIIFFVINIVAFFKICQILKVVVLQRVVEKNLVRPAPCRNQYPKKKKKCQQYRTTNYPFPFNSLLPLQCGDCNMGPGFYRAQSMPTFPQCGSTSGYQMSPDGQYMYQSMPNLQNASMSPLPKRTHSQSSTNRGPREPAEPNLCALDSSTSILGRLANRLINYI